MDDIIVKNLLLILAIAVGYIICNGIVLYLTGNTTAEWMALFLEQTFGPTTISLL